MPVSSTPETPGTPRARDASVFYTIGSMCPGQCLELSRCSKEVSPVAERNALLPSDSVFILSATGKTA